MFTDDYAGYNRIFGGIGLALIASSFFLLGSLAPLRPTVLLTGSVLAVTCLMPQDHSKPPSRLVGWVSMAFGLALVAGAWLLPVSVLERIVLALFGIACIVCGAMFALFRRRVEARWAEVAKRRSL